MKQSELAHWLEGILVAVAIFAAVGVFALAPLMGSGFSEDYPEFAHLFWPFMAFIWVSAIPFFASAVLAWKIFREIGRDNSFCEKNSLRLKYIGKLALFDAFFFVLGAVTLIVMNLGFPAVIVLLAFLTVAALGVAVVMAALSHLAYKAFLLKQDSDLTI